MCYSVVAVVINAYSLDLQAPYCHGGRLWGMRIFIFTVSCLSKTVSLLQPMQGLSSRHSFLLSMLSENIVAILYLGKQNIILTH